MQQKYLLRGILVFLNILIYSSADQADVKVRYLRIKSDIQSRFATTLVTTRLTNPSNEAKEISFTAQLPDAAFISNFSMQIGDKIIVGDVKEKEQARVAYEQARSRGESAGLVAQKARETNAFTISTNVAAHDKVTFNLTYQEILKRVHGAYKHVINLQSDKLQKSSDVEIDVRLVEQGKIVNVSVPKFGAKIGEKTNAELLKSKQDPNALINTQTAGTVSTTQITYKPKPEQIESSNGTLAGQLVVLYDVQRDLSGGEIQVVNGYFVHFFAPAGLPRGDKHVVFVLDKSGSMMGQKFSQTKTAMRRILSDLDQNDLFNMIMYNSGYARWKPESVRAAPGNVQEAIGYVNNSVADSTTNIYDPLVDALRILNSTGSDPLASMIVFMTDGQPNTGSISRPDEIVRSITERNENSKFIIHSVAFGDDADFNFMQRISTNNYGLARKVYEDLDADLQLTGFYGEISSPLLSDVKIEYLNETVDVGSLVRDRSYNYYDGGELVTLGKLTDDSPELVTFDASISARGASGPVRLPATANTFICPRRPIITEDDALEPCCLYPRCPPPVPLSTTERPVPGPSTVGGFVERMWAYQTIKKLLKEVELESGTNVTAKRQEALRLSLKYHFVTETTSMVVVQPNENGTALEKVSLAQDESVRRHGLAGPPPSIYARSFSRGSYAGSPVVASSIRYSAPRPPLRYSAPGPPAGTYASMDFDSYYDMTDSDKAPPPDSYQPTSTSQVTSTILLPIQCEAEILILIGPTEHTSSSPLVNFDRIGRLIDALKSQSAGRWSLRINALWISNGEGDNRTALVYQGPWGIVGQNGTQVQRDVQAAFMNASSRNVTSGSIQEMMEKADSMPHDVNLLLWVGQGSVFDPTDIIGYLADNYRFKSVGVGQADFESSLAKIRAVEFQKRCTF